MDEAKDDGGEDMDAKAFDRRARANVSVREDPCDVAWSTRPGPRPEPLP